MTDNRYGAILRVKNVNEALPLGLSLLQDRGVVAESRGLFTKRVPGPVSTVYSNPCERVLFDPIMDLDKSTKDMPCNDMIMLDLADGALNMTVCNRSNDAIWGAYGANAVQFSVLQEFIALMVGVKVGYYVQQSNNYHVYTDNPFWLKFREGEYEHGHVHNPYSMGKVQPYPLAVDAEDALMLYYDCIRLATQIEQGENIETVEYVSEYGRTVVQPVIRAYSLYKAKLYASAMAVVMTIPATDWRLAMYEWIGRRAERATAKATAKAGAL